MTKQYPNPPVIEAVSEFRLSPDAKWDLTIPGAIFDIVHEQFPNKEQRLVHELEFSQRPEGVQQQVRTSERVLFFSPDRKTFIQVGPQMLAINRLKPYPGWEEFKPNIGLAFNALNQVAEVKVLQRIGLRYVNRIEIPSHKFDLSEYFDFRPHTGENLPENIVNFVLSSMFSFTDGSEVCRVQLTPAVSEKPEFAAFVLDLDYFSIQPKTVSDTPTLEWVDAAHTRIENVFEGCITDRLRTLFGGNA